MKRPSSYGADLPSGTVVSPASPLRQDASRLAAVNAVSYSLPTTAGSYSRPIAVCPWGSFMKISVLGALAAALLGSTLAAQAEPVFNRIASFPVASNLPSDLAAETETSSEIITSTEDGRMLVYSDSPLGAIGLIDLRDPANPRPFGIVKVDGEPTSVTSVAGKVFVGINTSKSFTEPSGLLATIDIATRVGRGELRPRRTAGFRGAFAVR